MNRRKFLASLAAAGATTSLPGFGEDAAKATLAVDASKTGPTMRLDFTGLSYESAQLANPAFFAPSNRQLVELFRELSPNGNLRLGGGSSEFTTYSDADPVGPPPFEVFGPDTSKTEKHGTITTALALHNLRGFLDAAGWSCLYGLNLGQGTKENAATEAAAAFRILGPRLLALQIGNEPDSFRNRYRPAAWGPDDFLKEWSEFHSAIIAAVPGAKFAGPDISNKLPFLTAFAEQAPKFKDVILLTGHYYAMGPAGSPGATLDQLAEIDPKQATMHASGFPIVADAMRAASLPFRMSEGNSCWNGGQPGVSDTFASALWCADRMLRFAAMGWSGVNLHGGGDGIYSPITGAPSTGFVRRPEYYGIQFAQSFAGAQFVESNVSPIPAGIRTYTLVQAGHMRVAVLNQSGTAMRLTLPKRTTGHALKLTAPGLLSTDAVSFGEARVPRSREVEVAGYTGMIYEL
ncbi:MAG TPA: hypothetical protein VGN01_16345 [Acidobacteriaceae bacterium]